MGRAFVQIDRSRGERKLRGADRIPPVHRGVRRRGDGSCRFLSEEVANGISILPAEQKANAKLRRLKRPLDNGIDRRLRRYVGESRLGAFAKARQQGWSSQGREVTQAQRTVKRAIQSSDYPPGRGENPCRRATLNQHCGSKTS